MHKVNCSAATMSLDSLNPKCGITATLRLLFFLIVKNSTALFSLLSLWVMLNEGWHQKHHIVPQIQKQFQKQKQFLSLITPHTLQQQSQVHHTLK